MRLCAVFINLDNFGTQPINQPALFVLYGIIINLIFKASLIMSYSMRLSYALTHLGNINFKDNHMGSPNERALGGTAY